MHRRSDPFGSARNNQNRQRPCALATLGIVATPFSPLPPVQILWPYAGRASVLASHLGTRNIRGLARTLALPYEDFPCTVENEVHEKLPFILDRARAKISHRLTRVSLGRCSCFGRW